MTPTTSRRSSVAEPAVTLLPADPRIVPTRFAGLQAARALPPVVLPGPYGHLASASPEGIEAVMRRVWPGGRDAENRRARGARILLRHLDGFPGGSWQQRWEASGLNEARQPVNVLIPRTRGARRSAPVPPACSDSASSAHRCWRCGRPGSTATENDSWPPSTIRCWRTSGSASRTIRCTRCTILRRCSTSRSR